MKNRWKIKIVFLVILAIAAMGAIVMWLWNWLMPALFNFPMITFLQALGLMLLCRILFRGFFGMKGRHMHEGWGPWKNRYDKMSPEEKEKMRELWKKRCGGWNPCGDESKKDEV